MLALKTFTRTFVATFFVLGLMTWAREASAAIKVASWNIQVFGQKKVMNADVMRVIVDTVKQYDLILVQEIRDPTDIATTALMKQLNAATGNAYSILVSNRLGRANTTEQYAFIYKKSALKMVDSYHYADSADLFAREPFVVRFSTTQATAKNFFVVPLHAESSAAVAEIGSLVKVYDDAAKRWNIKNGILMGDWQAGCSYFAKKYWETNPLRSDSRFTWLIGDDTKSSVGKASCPYDRAVVAGDKLRAHAAKGRTVYLDTKFNLTTDSMKLVSDHYPIEFELN
ncbi:exonuclease/endonuclease/phosphatase family protein [Myxococcus virescens]|uniref:Deoxyribonuclease n=1 Tax=Myxococcus virescens TaxID=83456 RepID=A0A511HFM8_9BACT|nr:endonuclease/exonuclease/phosphatase family protein [Myxococcus virescens]GEL72353.1 deoxyribonuclease [Myxococcus virescens]SDF07940.1 deoxyribonuclease-1 [Myxococcus virescens]